MINRFLTNLRKLVAKPTKIDITIVDKAPIGKSRGEDKLLVHATNRQDVETTYTIEDIIDDIRGPKIRDGKDKDAPYEHIAKITGMEDPNDNALHIILKPNGLFEL